MARVQCLQVSDDTESRAGTASAIHTSDFGCGQEIPLHLRLMLSFNLVNTFGTGYPVLSIYGDSFNPMCH